jgi:N-acetylneuraminic acid mutarotase
MRLSKIWFILLLISAANLLLGQSMIYPEENALIRQADKGDANREDFIYEVQLLPGEEFSGYIYHWSEDGYALADLHENPEVAWLGVSPTNFLVSDCKLPQPVRYAFKAPMKTGTYETTVEDWEYNWTDTKVTLIVTETPTLKTNDSIIIIQGPGSIYYRYRTYEYHGITPSQDWYDDGYCGDDPYIVDSSRNISHTIFPPASGLGIVPDSFTLHLEEQKTVTKTFEITQDTPDSIYEAISLQWLSYPQFVKWKLVPADYYCLGWEKIPPLKIPSVRSGAEVFNDVIYVVGGVNPYTNTVLDRVEKFNGSAWAILDAKLNEPRSDFGTAVLDDRLYVFGGRDQNNRRLNSTEYFDGTEWVTTGNDLPVAVSGLNGAVVNNNYYVFGGETDNGYESALWRFSRLKGWQVLADSLPFAPRSCYRCVALGQLIYIIGGVYNSDAPGVSVYFSDVYQYDPATNAFHTLNPLNFARTDFACGVVDSMIYVAGGRSDDAEVSSTVEFFEPASGTWMTCTDSPDIAFQPAASVVNDDIFYLLGGSITRYNDTANYRDCYGSSVLNGITPKEPDVPAPTVVYLPNPMQDVSYVAFDLPYDSHVTFTLYDVRGRLIGKIADEELTADTYRIQIAGYQLAEGLYLGVLQTEKHTIVKKLVKVGD